MQIAWMPASSWESTIIAFEKNILEFLLEQSHKLINSAIDNLRQCYFHFNHVNPNRAFDLMEEMKTNVHYKILYSQVAQQVLHRVGESFRSFAELTQKFYTGKVTINLSFLSIEKREGWQG